MSLPDKEQAKLLIDALMCEAIGDDAEIEIHKPAQIKVAEEFVLHEFLMRVSDTNVFVLTEKGKQYAQKLIESKTK